MKTKDSCPVRMLGWHDYIRCSHVVPLRGQPTKKTSLFPCGCH
jgi:hypothetical protein